MEAKLLVLRRPSPALPLLPDSIYDGLPKCVFQRKKDQEEDTKTHLHQGCGNIENFLLHFKSILHLAFQKNAWWLSVCNSCHPQPFLLGCASGEVHPPPTLTPNQAPGLASISDHLACLLYGVPKRAQRHFGTSCQCCHLMPQLWLHALAAQTFFALTPNFLLLRTCPQQSTFLSYSAPQVNSIHTPLPAH